MRHFSTPPRGKCDWTGGTEKVTADVPEDRQQAAPSHIAGPALQNLVFLDEDSPLAELYLELLKRAIDKERSNEAHPAFIKIIEQLSPEEAVLLFRFRGQRMAPRIPREFPYERLS